MKRYFRQFSLVLLLCNPVLADKEARVIKYSDRDIVELRCQVRVSTTIVLPTHEQILDFTPGDKDLWIVNGAQNFCYVHPSKPGSSTNLNLICGSGNVYSFLLTEVSNQTPPPEIDYKIFIESKDSSSQVGMFNPERPRFVSAQDVAGYKKQIEQLQDQVAAVSIEANQAKDRELSLHKAKYPTSLHFVYDYKSAKPFEVVAIFHDDAFTYIHSKTREKPALYEIKDGKPNLVHFQLENDCYIIPKIIDRGYLQLGKRKMEFRRRGV